MGLVGEQLAAYSDELLDNSISFERGVGEDLADDEQHESDESGGFHKKMGAVCPQVFLLVFDLSNVVDLEDLSDDSVDVLSAELLRLEI